MKIVIMHQTVTNHDAIGNDIEGMFNLLKKTYECYVFAENQFNNQVTYVDYKALLSIIEKKDNLVIYHHSVYWQEGEEVLKRTKSKIIFRYHNITPPEFFNDYNDFHTQQCSLGRAQTGDLAELYSNAFWLCDSKYNTEDIEKITDKWAVCPPFHKTGQWDQIIPDEQIMKELLYSEDINLLFVGRVAPNKGHKKLLDILAIYKRNFTNKIHLNVIGKFDESLDKYNQEIEEKIKENGLEGNVSFIGEINDSVLCAYYLGSDFFICTSQHEGFCVPIIEAQYLELPIIALQSSAIAETIGKNQICLENNAKMFAAAIDILFKNKPYMRWLRREGKENYRNRFQPQIIEDSFLNQLDEWGIIESKAGGKR